MRELEQKGNPFCSDPTKSFGGVRKEREGALMDSFNSPRQAFRHAPHLPALLCFASQPTGKDVKAGDVAARVVPIRYASRMVVTDDPSEEQKHQKAEDERWGGPSYRDTTVNMKYQEHLRAKRVLCTTPA
eukprot:1140327-Pelagomonas_calceolata.AAC.1